MLSELQTPEARAELRRLHEAGDVISAAASPEWLELARLTSARRRLEWLRTARTAKSALRHLRAEDGWQPLPAAACPGQRYDSLRRVYQTAYEFRIDPDGVTYARIPEVTPA